MPLRMTEERIADARAWCEAATKLYHNCSHSGDGRSYVFALAREGDEVAIFTRPFSHCDDAEAYVGAMTDLPDLLADRALLMAVVGAPQWTPVTPETMPPSGLLVWLTDGEHVGPGRHNVTDSHNIHEWSGHRVGGDWRDYGSRRTPTHWMVIQVPAPPKEAHG